MGGAKAPVEGDEKSIGDVMEGWRPTWWGRAQLTHLPGVREYLRGQQETADDESLQMNILAEHGPQNLDQAWMYFKHWVKGQPGSHERILDNVAKIRDNTGAPLHGGFGTHKTDEFRKGYKPSNYASMIDGTAATITDARASRYLARPENTPMGTLPQATAAGVFNGIVNPADGFDSPNAVPTRAPESAYLSVVGAGKRARLGIQDSQAPLTIPQFGGGGHFGSALSRDTGLPMDPVLTKTALAWSQNTPIRTSTLPESTPIQNYTPGGTATAGYDPYSAISVDHDFNERNPFDERHDPSLAGLTYIPATTRLAMAGSESGPARPVTSGAMSRMRAMAGSESRF